LGWARSISWASETRSEAQSFRLRGRYPLRRAVPCTSPTTELCNAEQGKKVVEVVVVVEAFEGMGG
jgi:hypothetical protein